MRLELSRRAQADLADIRDYSLAEFGVTQAIAYLDSIESALRRILDFPDIGALNPAVHPQSGRLGASSIASSIRLRVARSLSSGSYTRRWTRGGIWEGSP